MDDEWVGGTNALVQSTQYGSESSEFYSRYLSPTIVAQVIIYLCLGFIFIAICALTDVPFYVMWIVFFLVWVVLYLDFIKRYHVDQLKKENDIAMESKTSSSSSSSSKKGKFDAYEAAGIDRGAFKHKLKRYAKACREAFARYKLAVIIGVLSIVIITGITTIFTNCMCVATSPVEASSYLSRRIGHKYCKEGEICNVYFTLADTERDMIINFHHSEDNADFSFTSFDVVSHSRGDFVSDNDWVDSYAFRSNATTFKMDTVRELTRYVNWVDVTNLIPDTTYYFIAAYSIKGELVVTEREYKVKSVPGDGTFTFVTGGDMSVDGDGEKLVKHAAAIMPDFAIIGGDNAYDNGFKSCYMRWDKWFDRWDRFMSANSAGYSIPIMLAIGNHEAGGFGQELGDDPYYTPYFPQQLGLQNIDPRFRLPYHTHRFGVNTTFVVLDTNTVVRMDGLQTEWLESQLVVPSKLKIMVYHGNLYPSSEMDFEISKIGRKNWAPLFDKYQVSMAFENHLHLYKRTKPIKNDKIDSDGVTYFGDGAWGVMTNIVKLSNKDYIETVNRKQHFFHVDVQNNAYVSLKAIEKSGKAFDTWEKEIPY